MPGSDVVSSSITTHSRNAGVASSRPMPSRPIASRKDGGDGDGDPMDEPGDGGREPSRGAR